MATATQTQTQTRCEWCNKPTNPRLPLKVNRSTVCSDCFKGAAQATFRR